MYLKPEKHLSLWMIAGLIAEQVVWKRLGVIGGSRGQVMGWLESRSLETSFWVSSQRRCTAVGWFNELIFVTLSVISDWFLHCFSVHKAWVHNSICLSCLLYFQEAFLLVGSQTILCGEQYKHWLGRPVSFAKFSFQPVSKVSRLMGFGVSHNSN